MSRKHKVFVFEVAGQYDFPVDMLRYDHCWPKTSEDAVKLMPHPRSEGFKGPGRSIVLVTHDSPPTEGRWRSFGWTCKVVQEYAV